MTSDEQSRRETVADMVAWMAELQAAGFTRDESILFIRAWQSRPVFPATSPDQEEILSKTRLIIDDTLEAIDRAHREDDD